MSSNNKLMRRLRKEPWFPPVTAELKRLGVEYEFLIATGRGHPKLAVVKGDKVVKMPVPSSGGGWTDYSYLVAEVRKLCEETSKGKDVTA